MNLSPISFLYIDSVRSEEGEKSKKSTNSEYCLHLKKFNSLKKCISRGEYTMWKMLVRWKYYMFALYLHDTGCTKKHGNSVTNSISSFQIILWFSIVIPTGKAVICKSFVCYVHILFVYVLTAYGCI